MVVSLWNCLYMSIWFQKMWNTLFSHQDPTLHSNLIKNGGKPYLTCQKCAKYRTIFHWRPSLDATTASTSVFYSDFEDLKNTTAAAEYRFKPSIIGGSKQEFWGSLGIPNSCQFGIMSPMLTSWLHGFTFRLFPNLTSKLISHIMAMLRHWVSRHIKEILQVWRTTLQTTSFFREGNHPPLFAKWQPDFATKFHRCNMINVPVIWRRII